MENNVRKEPWDSSDDAAKKLQITEFRQFSLRKEYGI